MSARPPAGATFEISSIAPGRRRRSLTPIAWSGLLVALIAFAVLGRTSSAPAAAAPPVPSPAGDVANAASLVPAPGDPFFRAPLFGAGPAELDSTISVATSTGDSEATAARPAARRVWITGQVFVRAETLIVAIESPTGSGVGAQTD